MSENLDAANVSGEQEAIAELAGKSPSPTYFGAVDRLIDESLDRAERITGARSALVNAGQPDVQQRVDRPVFGHRLSSAVNVAAITRSLNMLSATDRCSAGTVSGAAPRPRSALMAAVVSEIHFCMSVDHNCRTSGLVAFAAAPATATAR